MAHIVGHCTVFFNETRGSRFLEWEPEAEMVRSAYFIDSLVEITDGPDSHNLARLWVSEEMFRIGNRDNRVNGRSERSISIGDVIEVTIKTIDGLAVNWGGPVAMACDRQGFHEIDPGVWFEPRAVATRAALIPVDRASR